MCEVIRCAVAGEPVPKQRGLTLDERSSAVCNQKMMNEGRHTREECEVCSNGSPRRARPVQKGPVHRFGDHFRHLRIEGET